MRGQNVYPIKEPNLLAASKYHFLLPDRLIAQKPVRPRDHSRLLVIGRESGQLSHHRFCDLPRLLKPTDVLVFNNSAVIPARIYAHKPTGGKVEILLIRKLNSTNWEFISHPGLKPGQSVIVNHRPQITGQVSVSNIISFSNLKSLSTVGKTPLPPYIKSSQSESIIRRRYQTVYANLKAAGSAAAPTAGLHFTRRLLSRLTAVGIKFEFITLHVGLGTFKPPTPEQIHCRQLHSEYFTLSSQVASRLNSARSAGHRIIAVGTTTCRVLETCTDGTGRLHPHSGDTDIFILPGYKFRFTSGLITNFHLPGSSLIMLVSAFSSWPIIHHAYLEAISQNYRFYSFGDATLII